jgi:hypothetical protein
MKKFTILFFFISVVLSAFAQDFKAIDYKAIEKNVKDSSSPYYYPVLMERYSRGDSTFTIDEVRHLYYGYVFQPTYNPNDTSSYNNSLMESLSKTQLSEVDYRQIEKDADALLAEDPFNIRAINAKLLVYAQNNNVDEYKKLAGQRKAIMDAVLSSGDGITKKTAFYVIKVSHEYDLLNMFGYKYGGQNKLTDHFHYLSLAENRFGIDGLYFDITPVLDFMSRENQSR